MEVTMPSKLIIRGVTYDVIYKKDTSGGSFDIDKRSIVVGTMANNMETLDTLVHEALEGLLTDKGHRFVTSGEIRFVLDHAEFQNIVRDVVLIAQQIFGTRRKK